MEEKKKNLEEMNLNIDNDIKDVTDTKKEEEPKATLNEETKVQVKEEIKEEKDEPIFKEVNDPRFTQKNDFYFPLPQTSIEDNIKSINENRSSFFEYNKSNNRLKKIVLFSFVGIIGIIAIFLIIYREAMSRLMTPLFLVFFVFLLVTFLLQKRSKTKLNVAFDGYKYHYFLNVDSYAFYQTGISNLEFSYNSKISIEEINKIGCYENVIYTLTRDVVEGTMFGIPFLTYDLLLKTGTDPNDRKTMSTIFSGKMFHFDLFYKKAGKMVIYLKGCGDAHPTELSGLEPVEIKDLNKNYQVYSSYDNPSSTLNKKSIETLNKFKIDNVVEDIIITISKEGVYVGLSLTTENMTIPYEIDVNDNFLVHYKNDIEIIKTLVSDMLGSKNYEIPTKDIEK